MSKNLHQKEHPSTFEKSELFPEDRLQMQHSKLLKNPDYQPRALLHSSSIG